MEIEDFGSFLHEQIGVSFPLCIEDRVKVACACGYMDAKHMVHMKETYGFPLEVYVDSIRKRLGKLKIDYGGLEHELLMIGTNKHSVSSILDELKMVDNEWEMH